ncbi:hypothetical protein [Roseibium sp.]
MQFLLATIPFWTGTAASANLIWMIFAKGRRMKVLAWAGAPPR